jgi:predicted DNA-binding transcriptional regulator AlpA
MITQPSPCRAVRTRDAARYLGISISLLRKMRTRGPDDRADPGPSYIRLSPSLVVYQIADLDAWLDRYVQQPRRELRTAQYAA